MVLLNDTLELGKITACRHANGRDWWIIQPERNTNRFYRFYVGPEGIVLKGIQTAGVPVEDGTGQLIFSPDGSKFIRVKKTRSTEPSGTSGHCYMNYLYLCVKNIYDDESKNKVQSSCSVNFREDFALTDIKCSRS